MDFRPIETEDIRFAWAAYKTGHLASMGSPFNDTGMDADQFKEEFTTEIVVKYHGCWTLFAESKRGFGPVGFVLGFWSHPDPRFAAFMILGDIVWVPWATARNKVESAVKFFHLARAQIPFVEYASEKDVNFFNMICRHGIMRRVGTMWNVHPGGRTTVFETIKMEMPKWLSEAL